MKLQQVVEAIDVKIHLRLEAGLVVPYSDCLKSCVKIEPRDPAKTSNCNMHNSDLTH